MTIKLHNPQTWPDEIKEFIKKHKPLIRSYVESSKKCERSLEPDKYYYPEKEALEKFNCIAAEFDAFSNDLRRLLNPNRLEMVHCTKLLAHEIENIKNYGLRVLTTELVTERISSAFEYEYLTVQEKEFLLNDYQRKLNRNDYKYRQNQLWLVTPKRLSSHDCGAERLFTSWGGESVYNEHDVDQTPIAKKLKALGIPCIVLTSVRIADLQLGDIENAMIFESKVVNEWGRFHEFDDTHGDVEGFVEKDIPAEFVKEIIDIHNPKFSELYNQDLLVKLTNDLSIKQ